MSLREFERVCQRRACSDTTDKDAHVLHEKVADQWLMGIQLSIFYLAILCEGTVIRRLHRAGNHLLRQDRINNQTVADASNLPCVLPCDRKWYRFAFKLISTLIASVQT